MPKLPGLKVKKHPTYPNFTDELIELPRIRDAINLDRIRTRRRYVLRSTASAGSLACPPPSVDGQPSNRTESQASSRLVSTQLRLDALHEADRAHYPAVDTARRYGCQHRRQYPRDDDPKARYAGCSSDGRLQRRLTRCIARRQGLRRTLPSRADPVESNSNADQTSRILTFTAGVVRTDGR